MVDSFYKLHAGWFMSEIHFIWKDFGREEYVI